MTFLLSEKGLPLLQSHNVLFRRLLEIPEQVALRPQIKLYNEALTFFENSRVKGQACEEEKKQNFQPEEPAELDFSSFQQQMQAGAYSFAVPKDLGYRSFADILRTAQLQKLGLYEVHLASLTLEIHFATTLLAAHRYGLYETNKVRFELEHPFCSDRIPDLLGILVKLHEAGLLGVQGDILLDALQASLVKKDEDSLDVYCSWSLEHLNTFLEELEDLGSLCFEFALYAIQNPNNIVLLISTIKLLKDSRQYEKYEAVMKADAVLAVGSKAEAFVKRLIETPHYQTYRLNFPKELDSEPALFAHQQDLTNQLSFLGNPFFHPRILADYAPSHKNLLVANIKINTVGHDYHPRTTYFNHISTDLWPAFLERFTPEQFRSWEFHLNLYQLGASIPHLINAIPERYFEEFSKDYRSLVAAVQPTEENICASDRITPANPVDLYPFLNTLNLQRLRVLSKTDASLVKIIIAGSQRPVYPWNFHFRDYKNWLKTQINELQAETLAAMTFSLEVYPTCVHQLATDEKQKAYTVAMQPYWTNLVSSYEALAAALQSLDLELIQILLDYPLPDNLADFENLPKLLNLILEKGGRAESFTLVDKLSMAQLSPLMTQIGLDDWSRKDQPAVLQNPCAEVLVYAATKLYHHRREQNPQEYYSKLGQFYNQHCTRFSQCFGLFLASSKSSKLAASTALMAKLKNPEGVVISQQDEAALNNGTLNQIKSSLQP